MPCVMREMLRAMARLALWRRCAGLDGTLPRRVVHHGVDGPGPSATTAGTGFVSPGPRQAIAWSKPFLANSIFRLSDYSTREADSRTVVRNSTSSGFLLIAAWRPEWSDFSRILPILFNTERVRVFPFSLMFRLPVLRHESQVNQSGFFEARPGERVADAR